MDWEFGISKCKLLCIEWINNKVLLYSTGNYIQYPVTNHNGKEHEKEYIYMCVCVCVYHFAAAAAAKSLQSCRTLCDPIDGSPLCYTPETNTTL